MNPYEASTHGRIDRGHVWQQLHFPLLLAWGILPVVFSVRQLYYAIGNIKHVGRFYSGLIWDGLSEYAIFAMWLACLLLYSQRHPTVRLLRSVSVVPAFPIAILATLSICRHLLPGGTFYVPDVIARDAITEFLVYHLLYAVVFIPMAGYAVLILSDGYRALRFTDWRHPTNAQKEATNQGLHTERAW